MWSSRHELTRLEVTAKSRQPWWVHIFQWLGSLVSFHVGFGFLACQYYQDLIWFSKSESERWINLDTFRPFMMKLCFCNQSDTFLQLLPLCSCGPSGSTWAHMTRRRGVLIFCPHSGTSPVQWEQPTSGRCVRRMGRIVNQCPHTLSIWQLASIELKHQNCWQNKVKLMENYV